MSYILDALKKSEKERQRGSIPSLDSQQDNDSGPPKKKTRWYYWLIGALLFNALILIWWIKPWQSGEAEHSATALPGEQLAPSIPAQADTSSVSGVPGEGTLITPVPLIASKPGEPTPEKEAEKKEQEEAGAPAGVVQPGPDLKAAAADEGLENQQVLGVEEETANEEQPVAEVTGEEAAGVVEAQPEEQLDAASGDQQEDFPEEELGEGQEIAEPQERRQERPVGVVQKPAVSDVAVPDIVKLPASIRQQLPEIAISLHLYSKEPGRRKVSVNGRMMRENDSMDSLTVEEITPNGVIFSFEGKRFHKQVFR